MSNTRTTSSQGSVAIVVGIVVIVCVTILGATAVLLFAPETDIAPLIGIVAPTVAALGALAATQRVAGQVHETRETIEETKGTVDDLANGKMDAKIRSAVAAVLQPHMVDPDYDDDRKAADAAIVAHKLLAPHVED